MKYVKSFESYRKSKVTEPVNEGIFGGILNFFKNMWSKAMEELKARGIRRLDLGGVNTIRSAGIARFKMSTGGEVVTLAGTYF